MGGYDQLLPLGGEGESLDVDGIGIGLGQGGEVLCDVDIVDRFIPGGRLLADEPFEVGQFEVLSGLSDEGLKVGDGVLAEGTEGHVVFAEVIEHAGQVDGVAADFEVMDGVLDEGDERGVEVAGFSFAAGGCPIDDLGSTMGEFCDGEGVGGLGL
ncbi:MAG: hypothetical protein RI897_602 [Verrucomicrobiota bacterium]